MDFPAEQADFTVLWTQANELRRTADEVRITSIALCEESLALRRRSRLACQHSRKLLSALRSD